MAGIADKDRGFGFMKAFYRATVSKPSPEKDDLSEFDADEVETSEDIREGTAADLSEAQQSLKDQAAADEQNGLELWPLPGLAPMTRVRTSFGDVHAIALRKGDKVLMKNGEYKAIEWINRIMLDGHILNLKPDSNPVLVGAGSFGPGVPANDVTVSPRQIFCADEHSGLAKPREASMLLSRKGIRRIAETEMTYTMFHVGESAEIFCEGLFLRFPIET